MNDGAKKHHLVAIAPLLHCNSATFIMQYDLIQICCKRIRDASIYMSKKYRSSFYY